MEKSRNKIDPLLMMWLDGIIITCILALLFLVFLLYKRYGKIIFAIIFGSILLLCFIGAEIEKYRRDQKILINLPDNLGGPGAVSIKNN